MVSCRFAFAVHVLAVLAHQRESAGVCSEALAGSVNTNPVVIRRLLSQLRKAGIVKTRQGPCGGSVLAEKPAAISLDAVYRAVELAPSFSLHRNQPNRRCPVGAGIEEVLTDVFGSAQAALENALAQRNLQTVLDAMAGEKPERRRRVRKSARAI